MRKRYTKEEKRDLAKTITNMMSHGLTVAQAAARLNEQGTKMKNGGHWTHANLSTFRSQNSRYFAHAGSPVRTYNKRKTAITKAYKQNTERSVSINTISSILTDPALNSGQMVKMLCAYLEV